MIVDHYEWSRSVTGSVHPQPCVFGDLLRVLPADTFCNEDPFHRKLFKANRAKLMTSQWCFTCCKECPLFGPRAMTDIEVAGLPCTDASMCGLRRFENGPTAQVFLAHCKIHLERRTPMMIIENVPETSRII